MFIRADDAFTDLPDRGFEQGVAFHQDLLQLFRLVSLGSEYMKRSRAGHGDFGSGLTGESPPAADDFEIEGVAVRAFDEVVITAKQL